MTIHLPEHLEAFLRQAVTDGRFASVDDAMTEAATLLLRTLNQASAPPEANGPAAPAHKPIWDVADELRKSIPAEEWAKLPVDGAAQHDHYIHGAPKRHKA